METDTELDQGDITRMESLSPEEVRVGRRYLLLLPMVLATAACYFFQDFYPLSHFPMYSKFDDRTYYVYLKGADGKAVAAVPNFRIFTSDLKKHYGRDLNDLKGELKGSHFEWTEKEKWKAGMATLNYLRNERSPGAFKDGAMSGLTLIDVRIQIGKDGKLSIREDVVGRIEEE